MFAPPSTSWATTSAAAAAGDEGTSVQLRLPHVHSAVSELDAQENKVVLVTPQMIHT